MHVKPRKYTWLQLKIKPIMLTNMEGGNMFNSIESLTSNSIFYEINKLKVLNSRLNDEINKHKK
jgi:hypothetical protein